MEDDDDWGDAGNGEDGADGGDGANDWDDDDGDGGSRGGGSGGGSGGAAEEWESAEFDDDANGADMVGEGDDAEAALSVDIQVANLFYEAEDMLRERPAEALSKFRAVLELCKGGDAAALSDESRTALFSSLVHIVVLSYDAGAVAEMVEAYVQLLAMLPRVTRNEGAEAIDSVLNAVASSRDYGLLTRVYSITSEALQRMADMERMLFNVNMKLCRSHIDRDDLAQAQAVLDGLHASCRLPDGEDDKKNKGAELIEIYALMIKISSISKDNIKMKVRPRCTPTHTHTHAHTHTALRSRRSVPLPRLTTALLLRGRCAARVRSAFTAAVMSGAVRSHQGPLRCSERPAVPVRHPRMSDSPPQLPLPHCAGPSPPPPCG